MTTAITVSERAARRIGEILKGEGDGAMPRISVEGGGCSGFQYKFDVDRSKTEDDLVISREGAVVLVDSASVPFLATWIGQAIGHYSLDQGAGFITATIGALVVLFIWNRLVARGAIPDWNK